MCNTCNIARKAYDKAVKPFWEAYYNNTQKPFWEAYENLKKHQATVNPFWEAYREAEKNCKDAI